MLFGISGAREIKLCCQITAGLISLAACSSCRICTCASCRSRRAWWVWRRFCRRGSCLRTRRHPSFASDGMSLSLGIRLSACWLAGRSDSLPWTGSRFRLMSFASNACPARWWSESQRLYPERAGAASNRRGSCISDPAQLSPCG